MAAPAGGAFGVTVHWPSSALLNPADCRAATASAGVLPLTRGTFVPSPLLGLIVTVLPPATLPASGDCALQCKTDLSICAGEIEIKGTTVDLMGKATGVDASAAASVTIKGNLVALKGSTIDINPGGVPKAAKCDGKVSEVPDGGGGGGGSGGSNGGSGGGNGGNGGGGNGGNGGGGNGGGPGGGNGGGPGGGNGGNGTDPGGGNTPVEERPPLDLHAIEITVVNALDQPAVGVYYELRTPDGRSRTGTTDSAGLIKLDDIEKPGDCQLVFPDVDAQAPAEPPPDEPPPMTA